MNLYIFSGEKGCRLAVEKQAIAIVVDALRASATLSVLFQLKVSEVFVVPEVELAFKLKNEHPEALLVGERNNIKIEGFDFGNSPVEILNAGEEVFKGKKVIFTSTSGARRIIACKGAKAVLVGSCINAKAVSEIALNIAKKENADIVVIPAGVFGKKEWSTEDLYAGSFIANKFPLSVKAMFPEVKENKDLKSAFFNSCHGKELIKAGFEKDVEFCSKADVINAVPRVFSFERDTAILKTYAII